MFTVMLKIYVSKKTGTFAKGPKKLLKMAETRTFAKSPKELFEGGGSEVQK